LKATLKTTVITYGVAWTEIQQ